jgi:hypothetical protein
MATPPGRKAVTLTLDRDALDLLRHLAPSGKAHGHFLSELVRAEALRREVRREERQRIAQELVSGQTLALANQ